MNNDNHTHNHTFLHISILHYLRPSPHYTISHATSYINNKHLSSSSTSSTQQRYSTLDFRRTGRTDGRTDGKARNNRRTDGLRTNGYATDRIGLKERAGERDGGRERGGRGRIYPGFCHHRVVGFCSCCCCFNTQLLFSPALLWSFLGGGFFLSIVFTR